MNDKLVPMDPLIAMIERVARDPSMDLSRLEKLLEMKERVEMRAAEALFNETMSLVQGEMTQIARDSHNPQTRSRYASYAAIDKVIHPIYTKHGMRVSFDEEEITTPDVLRVVAIVTKGRHTERYHYDSPINTKGIKGGEMMTLTHARASADTYARRYLVGRIFNLASTDKPDDDGNSAEPVELVSQEQRDLLYKLIQSTHLDIGTFCTRFTISALPDLPADKFDTAMKLLQKRAADLEAQK